MIAYNFIYNSTSTQALKGKRHNFPVPSEKLWNLRVNFNNQTGACMSIQNSGLNYIVYITLDTRTDHTKSVLRPG